QTTDLTEADCPPSVMDGQVVIHHTEAEYKMNTTLTSTASSRGALIRQDSHYAWYVVFLLTFAYTVAFIDRQVLNLLVDPIKLDLLLSDVDISFLQGFAFMSAYGMRTAVRSLGGYRAQAQHPGVRCHHVERLHRALRHSGQFLGAVPGACRRRRRRSQSGTGGLVADRRLLHQAAPAPGDEHLPPRTVTRRWSGAGGRWSGDRLCRRPDRTDPGVLRHVDLAGHLHDGGLPRSVAGHAAVHRTRAGTHLLQQYAGDR